MKDSYGAEAVAHDRLLLAYSGQSGVIKTVSVILMNSSFFVECQEGAADVLGDVGRSALLDPIG